MPMTKIHEQFKKVSQWLLHGGSIAFGSTDHGSVKVSISDSGGCAPGWSAETKTFGEALEWAETKVSNIIKSNEQIVELYKKGELDWPDNEHVKIPGIPPIKNPKFKP